MQSHGNKFFRSIVAAGSHQNAIELVRKQSVDASAIDSTVLEIEILHRPEIRQDIRIIATLGPSPIPPLVISKQVDSGLQEQLQTALLEMHTDPEDHALLLAGLISHFVQVSYQYCDPIRRMDRIASQVSFEPTE